MGKLLDCRRIYTVDILLKSIEAIHLNVAVDGEGNPDGATVIIRIFKGKLPITHLRGEF